MTSLLRFAIQSDFIGKLDLLEHLSVADLFGLGSDYVSKLHLLNGAGQLLLFALTLLSLLNSIFLAFLNLVNNDSGTSALGLDSQALTLVLGFESLQALDLHHDVKTLLLGKPVTLEKLVLRELLVTNGYDLSVEGHLVHVLYVVVLFVHLLLSTGKESISAKILLNLILAKRKFVGTSTVHLHHFCLASFSLVLLLLLLLLIDGFHLSLFLVSRKL